MGFPVIVTKMAGFMAIAS